MAKKIIHFGHPILRWCAMNTAIMENHQGELRPSKKDSTERIDAMVASIMAVGRLFNHEDKEDHGVDYGGMVTV